MEISKEERNWAMGAHLSTFLGSVIPFANIIAPLIVWLVKKDEMTFASEQAKEALNFQITVTIASFVAAILIFVFIGFLLLPLILITDIVLTIMAAIKASEGEGYRYPMTLRLIK